MKKVVPPALLSLYAVGSLLLLFARFVFHTADQVSTVTDVASYWTRLTTVLGIAPPVLILIAVTIGALALAWDSIWRQKISASGGLLDHRGEPALALRRRSLRQVALYGGLAAPPMIFICIFVAAFMTTSTPVTSVSPLPPVGASPVTMIPKGDGSGAETSVRPDPMPRVTVAPFNPIPELGDGGLDSATTRDHVLTIRNVLHEPIYLGVDVEFPDGVKEARVLNDHGYHVEVRRILGSPPTRFLVDIPELPEGLPIEVGIRSDTSRWDEHVDATNNRPFYIHGRLKRDGFTKDVAFHVPLYLDWSNRAITSGVVKEGPAPPPPPIVQIFPGFGFGNPRFRRTR